MRELWECGAKIPDKRAMLKVLQLSAAHRQGTTTIQSGKLHRLWA